jgi:hypothetical protein
MKDHSWGPIVAMLNLNKAPFDLGKRQLFALGISLLNSCIRFRTIEAIGNREQCLCVPVSKVAVPQLRCGGG